MEERKLYLSREYPTLFSYLTDSLKFGEAAAYQRLAALKALKGQKKTQVVDRLNRGALNLTGLSEAKRFFDQCEKSGKKLSLKERSKILDGIEGKGKTDRERFFREQIADSQEAKGNHPEINPTKRDYQRAIQKEVKKTDIDGTKRISITLTAEAWQKLEQAKGMLGHQLNSNDISELIEKMAEKVIEIKTPKSKRKTKKTSPTETPINSKKIVSDAPILACEVGTSQNSREKKRTRYIPVSVKAAVWERDQGRCRYKDPMTGKVCGSTFKLQYDHLRPFALGGEHSVENLELKCSRHNALAAVAVFGNRKIERFKRNRPQK